MKIIHVCMQSCLGKSSRTGKPLLPGSSFPNPSLRIRILIVMNSYCYSYFFVLSCLKSCLNVCPHLHFSYFHSRSIFDGRAHAAPKENV